MPNVLVIGAAKCGTTSLHHYLNLHPEIAMSREKELHFFVGELNWKRGRDWYASHFDAAAPVRGESSVGYTAFPHFQDVAQRMHSVVPQAKLIYMVRDPVDRILSAYVQRFSDRRENRPLSQALLPLAGNDLVERSRYHYQLQQFLPYYDLSRILVVCLEELQGEREHELARIYEFLGVDPGFRDPGMFVVKHQTRFKRRKSRFAIALKRFAETRLTRFVSQDTRRWIGRLVYQPLGRPIERPTLDSTLRRQLEDYIRPDLEQLRRLTRQSYASWSV